MQEFDDDDFLKMQEQAIRRVREMQKRSAFPQNAKSSTADEDDVKIYKKIKNLDEKSDSDNLTKTQKIEDIKKPTRHAPNTQVIKRTAITKAQRGDNMLTSFLSMDNDTALILPLLLLLGKEGADDILLLALLYILT